MAIQSVKLLQLNVTQAEIENLSAEYDYQTQNAALKHTVASGEVRRPSLAKTELGYCH